MKKINAIWIPALCLMVLTSGGRLRGGARQKQTAVPVVSRSPAEERVATAENVAAIVSAARDSYRNNRLSAITADDWAVFQGVLADLRRIKHLSEKGQSLKQKLESAAEAVELKEEKLVFKGMPEEAPAAPEPPPRKNTRGRRRRY